MGDKRTIFLIILASAVIISGGVFLFFKKPAQIDAVSLNLNIKKSAEPSFPKIENFQVPISMYHYIRNAEGESELGKNLSVSPENFAEHIKWLKENDYETLRVIDLLDPDRKLLSKIYAENKKPIILTFDDGYLDAYTNAFPILQENQMHATFYVIRDYVGRPEYMNANQIQELQNEGMEIGSHTLTHPNLTKIDLEDAAYQIADSKQNALTFCYPAGAYNESTVDLVRQAGYGAAVTTKFGIADQNSDLLELPRVRIEDGSAEKMFYKIQAAGE